MIGTGSRHARMLFMLLTCATAGVLAGELPVKVATIDASPPQNPWAKIAADFNGDGLPDVAVGGSKGPLVWYEYPSWNKTLVAEGGYNTVEGEAADIDGDGDQDIVMGGIFWYENPGPKGDPRHGPWTAHRVADVRTHDVEVGDLNGDGHLDLVTRNQSSFGNPSGDRFHVWIQTAGGGWDHREVSCPHGEGIQIADLDRDGDPDVVLPARWYENSGDPLNGPWTSHAYAAAWKHPDAEVQVSDLNGDGLPDIVLAPAELQGDRYRMAWYEASANVRAGNWSEHVIEAGVETVRHALGIGDMDGDGAPDIVTAEMHQGADPDEVLVYLNGSGGQEWKRQVLSTKGSHDIVLADIAADGDLDIIGANHGGDYQPVELWENLTSGKSGR